MKPDIRQPTFTFMEIDDKPVTTTDGKADIKIDPGALSRRKPRFVEWKVDPNAVDWSQRVQAALGECSCSSYQPALTYLQMVSQELRKQR